MKHPALPPYVLPAPLPCAAGPLRLRLAAPDDLPEVVRLLQQLSREPLHPREDPGPPLPPRYGEILTALQDTPGHDVFVADREGDPRLRGTFHLSVFPLLTDRGIWVAQVEAVAVDAPQRGQGVGEALMRWVLDYARRCGCQRVQLTSNAARHDAHRFYERLGFVGSHLGMKRPL